jgi:hypothetical protein
MTSPVDTTVKHFFHLMDNAPSLSGAAGSLIPILDACLVTGWDTKAIGTLVVAGGVATATFSGVHASRGDAVIVISGVTGVLAGLNGEQKVATRGAASLTFPTSEADGTATGTISMKMAPLGWTKVYTGANKAVYRSADPASSGMYLRVDDAGTTSCRVVGYETMSDVDTGLAAFPTNTQVAGGGYWQKSNVASATVVPWAIVGDSRAFYFFQAGYASQAAVSTSGNVRMFGDIAAYRPGGDAYGCMLSCSANAGAFTGQQDGVLDSNTSLRQYFPREYTGIGSAVAYLAFPYTGVGSTQSGGDNTLGAFPNPLDGALKLSKRYLGYGAGSTPRGELPGFFTVPQTGVGDSFKTGDRTPGSGVLAGRNLLCANTTVSYSTVFTGGAVFWDVTGPWAR